MIFVHVVDMKRGDAKFNIQEKTFFIEGVREFIFPSNFRLFSTIFENTMCKTFHVLPSSNLLPTSAIDC